MDESVPEVTLDMAPFTDICVVVLEIEKRKEAEIAFTSVSLLSSCLSTHTHTILSVSCMLCVFKYICFYVCVGVTRPFCKFVSG